MPALNFEEKRELTPRALCLGALLSMVMAMANVYLGLKVGMTVSASIPSAVLSMLILRKLRGSNALENNIVQTAASAGESLAAGFIFTLPALLILENWTEVHYLFSVVCISMGGALGVVFSVPLRKMFVVREGLAFPEGVATAEILATAHENKADVKALIIGGIAGAVFKFLEAGLGVFKSSLEIVLGGAGAFYGLVGIGLSPALLGVGYIVGFRIGVVILAGGLISWVFGLPLLADIEGRVDIIPYLHEIWSSKIRYLGVGAMLVGGLWTLLSVRKALAAILRAEAVDGEKADLSNSILIFVLCILSLGVTLGAYYLTQSLLQALIVAAILLPSCFIFSAVAAYMAGLVGSSNNPVSGVCIATVLLAGLVFSALMLEPIGALLTVSVGAFVCCASAVAGDNLQDLKAGRILGATPYKQQIMQFVGVFSAAIVIPPVLSLLHKSYGIGGQELVAPQATLVAGIVEGVFSAKLPWELIAAGAVLAIICIVVDEALRFFESEWRAPVLALAVGIYLPIFLSVTIVVGSLLTSLGSNKNTGILTASGLITGEALMGIFVALLVTTGFDLRLGWTFSMPVMLCYFIGLSLLFLNLKTNRP